MRDIGASSVCRFVAAKAFVRAFNSDSGLVRGRPGVRQGDRGATATEYAFVAGLIAVVIVGVVTVFGRNVSGLFNVPSSVFAP